MHEQLRNGGTAEELRGDDAFSGDGELGAALLRGSNEVRRSGRSQ